MKGSVDELQVSSIVVPNNRGTEDVHLLAGGPDGVELAKAIESAFADVLRLQMRRKEFSGHIQIIVLAMTPTIERKPIGPMLRQLRALCAELSTADGPYRVTLTYQRDSPAPVLGDEPAAGAEPAYATYSSGVSGGMRTRAWFALGVGVVVVLFVAAKYLWPGPFPSSIEFGKQHLEKATDWERGKMSGVVYVLPGDKLPNASMQVGVIVSRDYPTAEDLDRWIRVEYLKAAGNPYHESDDGRDACKVGAYAAGNDTRVFLSLTSCKTGATSATCVEADEPLAMGIVTQCKRATDSASCFDDICARRWEARREPLDALSSRFLSK